MASTGSSPVAQPCPSAVYPEVNVLLAAPSPVLDLYLELAHTLQDLQVGQGSFQTQGPSSESPTLRAPRHSHAW